MKAKKSIYHLEKGVRRYFYLTMGVALVVFLTIMVGPRPAIEETVNFSPEAIGNDPAAYLAKSEAAITGIRPGAEKEIVWADPATKARTPLSVIYIHGFSATKWETRPLPDIVARELGANLYFARLAGHGMDGQALASVSMGDWVDDLSEAIAIGEQIGERIVIISASTGGTLVTWAADHARLMNKVVGSILISPNFEVHGVSIGLLNMPWGKYILPKVMGETRSWEPENEEHGKWWTTSYPSRAVFPMAALMKAVQIKNYANIKLPSFFIISTRDTVVVPAATNRLYNEWGGPKKLLEVVGSDDPAQHVIAGDILSPSTTQAIAREIVVWIRSLPR
ncbi:MAG: alpha/beta fold hydrolase [Rhizobiaceae bacterium]